MKDERMDSDVISCDLCVIGGGSAGLSVAAGAVQMGASVALIERGAMGGDCLNTGCVPSKSLIAAAHAAHAGRQAGHFGIRFGEPDIAFGRVHGHVHRVIAAIAPHDSIERFERLGVRVIQGSARFTGPDEVAARRHRVRARRFVIATGSRAVLPPVKGLAEAAPLTNETIFDLRERPSHLVIIGGGPIGLEMAQAFRRLGSAVTVLERFNILPRDEPEAADILRPILCAEGIDLQESVELTEVGRSGTSCQVVFRKNGEDRQVVGSHLFVAAGRAPVVDGLGLEAAGIASTSKGITVDARLRTSNRKVFAMGDVTGGPQFTHVAGYHAGIVIRNALFGLPAKVNYAALPSVTYLDPEVAHVGLTEAEARKMHAQVTALGESFAANDRAQAEGRTEGLVKIVIGRRGRILGATIIAPHAGEMIGLWGVAISRKLPVSAIAGAILPYPTMAELSKRVAGQYFTGRLYGPRVRSVVRAIQRWLP